MANNRKNDAELRDFYLKKIMDFLKQDEEVMQTKSNEFVFPCTDAENNDKWIQIVVKVPTGERNGEPFDGYSLAEDYALKLKMKAEKKKEQEEKKQKKIERDKKKREAKNGE